MRSSVASAFAVATGLRYGMISTETPTPMRVVCAAINDIATNRVDVGPRRRAGVVADDDVVVDENRVETDFLGFPHPAVLTAGHDFTKVTVE